MTGTGGANDGGGKKPATGGASGHAGASAPGSGGASATGGDTSRGGASATGGVTGSGGAHTGGTGGAAGSGAGGSPEGGMATTGTHGTWVLALQRSDAAGVKAAFGSTPELVGISVRFGWTGLAAKTQDDLDFWRGIANDIGRDAGRSPALAIRFMAGRNTPPDVIARAPVSVQDGDDGGPLTSIPSPCLPDGSPNGYFEEAYLSFLGVLARWATTHAVSIVHLPWFGNKWDELYVGPEVVDACGDTARVKAFRYADTNLVKAHEHLFDRVLDSAKGLGITIELPLSGQGGVAPYTKLLADYIGKKVAAAAMHDRTFLQSNAWGLDGGIPMTSFWACQPTAHAFQELSVKTPDTDWPALYNAVRDANGSYVEVYLPSFAEPNTPALRAEVARFAGDEGPWKACP